MFRDGSVGEERLVSMPLRDVLREVHASGLPSRSVKRLEYLAIEMFSRPAAAGHIRPPCNGAWASCNYEAPGDLADFEAALAVVGAISGVEVRTAKEGVRVLRERGLDHLARKLQKASKVRNGLAHPISGLAAELQLAMLKGPPLQQCTTEVVGIGGPGSTASWCAAEVGHEGVAKLPYEEFYIGEACLDDAVQSRIFGSTDSEQEAGTVEAVSKSAGVRLQVSGEGSDVPKVKAEDQLQLAARAGAAETESKMEIDDELPGHPAWWLQGLGVNHKPCVEVDIDDDVPGHLARWLQGFGVNHKPCAVEFKNDEVPGHPASRKARKARHRARQAVPSRASSRLSVGFAGLWLGSFVSLLLALVCAGVAFGGGNLVLHQYPSAEGYDDDLALCQAFAVHCEGDEGAVADAEFDFEVLVGTAVEQVSEFWRCQDFDEVCGELVGQYHTAEGLDDDVAGCQAFAEGAEADFDGVAELGM
jgi:hypothetical protein